MHGAEVPCFLAGEMTSRNREFCCSRIELAAIGSPAARRHDASRGGGAGRDGGGEHAGGQILLRAMHHIVMRCYFLVTAWPPPPPACMVSRIAVRGAALVCAH